MAEIIETEKKGATVYLTIKRPEAMNALNKTLLTQLKECFDDAENNPGVKVIVIGSLGKAFVAGADIEFFVKSIKTGTFEDIESFCDQGHIFLNQIENSQKLVIARTHGMALGGGLELALACDSIVASDKASFGFPETGIGIYPGFGGMQRAMRKVGKPLAKYLVFTGTVLDAATALKMGLVEYLVPSDTLDRKIDEIVKDDRLVTKRNIRWPELSNDLRRIEQLFSDDYLDNLLSGRTGKDDFAGRLAKIISEKAPLAIQKAREIMDQGENMALTDAFELEKANLRYIFGTQDALQGLSSVGKRQPAFKGR